MWRMFSRMLRILSVTVSCAFIFNIVHVPLRWHTYSVEHLARAQSGRDLIKQKLTKLTKFSMIS